MSDNTTPSSNPYSAPGVDFSSQADTETDQLAGRFTRLVAVFIDGILMALLVLGPLILVTGGWTSYLHMVQSHQTVWKIGGGVIGWIVYLAVNGVFLARDGQSIGKKLLGIKIVRANGAHAEFGRIAVLRLGFTYVLQIIPFLGGILALVDCLLIFRESRQCLHDQIADTIVVTA